MHHLCLETDDLEELIADSKTKGFRLINETPIEEPGRKMAFVHPVPTAESYWNCTKSPPKRNKTFKNKTEYMRKGLIAR